MSDRHRRPLKPKFEMDDAITTAAARAYHTLGGQEDIGDVLWQTLEQNGRQPEVLVFMKDGLQRFIQLRDTAERKSENIQASASDSRKEAA